MDETQIQEVIFNIARHHKMKPANFFETLYVILLGTPAGPRMGPYIVAMGQKNVIDALERTVKQNHVSWLPPYGVYS